MRHNGPPSTPLRLGAIRVTTRAPGVDLYFPPLRAAGSALMLALFGVACGVIGAAAVAGLVRSGSSEAATMLALAFAGVFALPLTGLGLVFIAIALWTALNSLTVEVDIAGLRTARRWLGFEVARRTLPRHEIAAIEIRPTAKYIGAFGALPYYRLVARGRDSQAQTRSLLIADSLKGQAMAENVKNIIITNLGMPELAQASTRSIISAQSRDS
jgi:hypothetical protein